jgi:hypothetical protein
MEHIWAQRNIKSLFHSTSSISRDKTCKHWGGYYLWNNIHWPTVEMESCVSFNDDSFARRPSSVNAMMKSKSRREGFEEQVQCSCPRHGFGSGVWLCRITQALSHNIKHTAALFVLHYAPAIDVRKLIAALDVDDGRKVGIVAALAWSFPKLCGSAKRWRRHLLGCPVSTTMSSATTANTQPSARPHLVLPPNPSPQASHTLTHPQWQTDSPH